MHPSPTTNNWGAAHQSAHKKRTSFFLMIERDEAEREAFLKIKIKWKIAADEQTPTKKKSV